MDNLAADLDAFSLEHRFCGDLDGGIEEAGDGTARVWLACLSLLTDLDAFFTDYHHCGDMEAGVDWPRVWIACDCGPAWRGGRTRRRNLRSTVEPPHRPAMDRRRFLLTSLAGALAAPLAAGAQQAGKVYRVGFLRAGQPPKFWIDEFRDGLREAGYVEGQNLIIEYRIGTLDQLPQFAEELVRLKADVILASASSAGIAAKTATTTVPIVFTSLSHPVEIGLIKSLAHPGGNITGLTVNAAAHAGKRLELLRELVPTLKHVAVLTHPGHPTDAVQRKEMQEAARALGLELNPTAVRGLEDLEAAFKAVGRADGLINVDTPLFTTHRARFAELAAKGRLPAIWTNRTIVEAGGLMSFGTYIPALFRRAAIYVDRVLKGTRPGDLPVEQPTKFELVINRKTAKALGLTIPPSLLARADQIIE